MLANLFEPIHRSTGANQRVRKPESFPSASDLRLRGDTPGIISAGIKLSRTPDHIDECGSRESMRPEVRDRLKETESLERLLDDLDVMDSAARIQLLNSSSETKWRILAAGERIAEFTTPSQKSMKKSPLLSKLFDLHKQRKARQEILPTASSKRSAARFVKEIHKNPRYIQLRFVTSLKVGLRNEPVEWMRSFLENGGDNGLVTLLLYLHKKMQRDATAKSAKKAATRPHIFYEVLRCLRVIASSTCGFEQLRKRPLILQTTKFIICSSPPIDLQSRQFIINLWTEIADGELSPEDRDLMLDVLADNSPLIRPQCAAPSGLLSHSGGVSGVDILQQEVPRRQFYSWVGEIERMAAERNQEWSGCRRKSRDILYQLANNSKRSTTIVPPTTQTFTDWEATEYITSHLRLLNTISRQIDDVRSRIRLRKELAESGFDRIPQRLRLCRYDMLQRQLKAYYDTATADDISFEQARNVETPGQNSELAV